MESTTERSSLRQEIEIAATPETVWAFLVDPEKAVRWWGTTVELDVRPGGTYRVETNARHIARGEYLEVEPPRRLVYSFGWEAGTEEVTALVPVGSSTVEIELEPSAGGTTLGSSITDSRAESSIAHEQGLAPLPRAAAARRGRRRPRRGSLVAR